jgi:hypothetical protein
MVDEINTNETGSHVQRGHNTFIYKWNAISFLKFLKKRMWQMI